MPTCADRHAGYRLLGAVASALLLASCGKSHVESPRPALTPIHAVQGDGYKSPFDGQTVTINGVVTGDFQDGDANETANLGGFFVQEEVADDDPATSDGIFVYDGEGQTIDVLVGYRVRVEGTVTEFFGETQIKASKVTRTGIGTIAPTPLEFSGQAILNADGRLVADFERFEGMLVQLAESLYVSDLSALERYGEIVLSRRQRLRQFTNFQIPDVDDYLAHQQGNVLSSLRLDDGIAAQNPTPSRFLDTARNFPIRAGDVATNVIGNIRYSRAGGSDGIEAFRLVPTSAIKFIDANPRPEKPPETGGSLRVATFNMLNFFTGLDDGEPVCGPAGDAECRGADSQAEFSRQRAKTVSTLRQLDADIVGVMEVENNGGKALASLVDGLNESGGGWAYIDTGTIATDAIAVGLIYRSAAVEPAGDFAILDGGADARFDAGKNRPSLAQTFRALDSGAMFTVVVNHLKSKGSDCDELGDRNQNDGQGNCNRTRTRAVEALLDWLATDPTGSSDPDVLVIGDLNAYLMEDPVRTLDAAGYVNLLQNDDAAGGHYSYVFDGQAGALDHAFASPALAEQVTGAAAWHINADEAPLFDYNLEFGRSPALFDAASPFRASDHDPLLVGLDLNQPTSR